MTPRVASGTHTATLRAFFDHHHNEWFTVREIAAETGLLPGQVQSGLNTLTRKGEVIDNESYPHPPATARQYRTAAGFLPTSTFKPRRLPEVIFIAEEAIVGPFCQHCGNPSHVHGPKGECLNYRIHPLLPVGDLPRPSKRET